MRVACWTHDPKPYTAYEAACGQLVIEWAVRIPGANSGTVDVRAEIER